MNLRAENSLRRRHNIPELHPKSTVGLQPEIAGPKIPNKKTCLGNCESRTDAQNKELDSLKAFTVSQ